MCSFENVVSWFLLLLLLLYVDLCALMEQSSLPDFKEWFWWKKDLVLWVSVEVLTG
jgi:hypothetical protein